MNSIERELQSLSERLHQLEANHTTTGKEINDIKTAIAALTGAKGISPELTHIEVESASEEKSSFDDSNKKALEALLNRNNQSSASTEKASPFNLEAFIGENVISKIGIAITILGAVIGAKYSIDHDLITPQTRLVLGALLGGALLFLGIKLKPKYDLYSAVLTSGSLTILYFIAFAAHSFYGFIPQAGAFLLMTLITAAGVYLALWHKKQMIAHVGLIGAYAVPFLLSNDSGNAAFLFGFITLVNAGILVIAFFKNWRELRFTSFGFTWVIFLAWFLSRFHVSVDVPLAVVFLSSSFVLFYASILAFKLKHLERLDKIDIVLLMSNTLVFFGFVYGALIDHTVGKHLLGLLAICIAGVHLLAAMGVYRQKLADKNLFNFLIGLTLVFVIVAVPLQFDSHWVTLLWTGQALALFVVGQKKGAVLYERMAYPMMILAFVSMIQDLGEFNLIKVRDLGMVVLNINFLTSFIFCSVFSFIAIKQKASQKGVEYNSNEHLLRYMAPAFVLFISFFAIRIEMGHYWSKLIHYAESAVEVSNNNMLKTAWLINYNLVFCFVLVTINVYKIRSQKLSLVGIGLSMFSVLFFLLAGLYNISELRESFLSLPVSQRPFSLIGIRYISLIILIVLIWALSRYRNSKLSPVNLSKPFDLGIHVVIIWLLSSELLHWLDFADIANSYKLGLSIMWGLYALFLIVLGIVYSKKHLRIMAIGLFLVTLIKLFAYDIAHLKTLSKTIVLLSLGVLLLIISFLYNKYRSQISEEPNPLENKES